MSISTVILMILAAFSSVGGRKFFENHKLKSGDTMNIWPRTDPCSTESHWSFEACDGCKIVLSCALTRRTCADHMVTVYNGKLTTRHCGPSESYLLKTSHQNWMNVVIENHGLKPGSYCRISVTKPYHNAQHEPVDSSEHGLGTGATRYTSCNCGWSNKSPARITGGHETSPNEFPYAALIMLKKRRSPYCGATIITSRHVLTAAHCTSPFHGVELSAIVGEHDLTSEKDTPYTRIIDVARVYDHPSYNNQTNVNDLSILLLKDKITFNQAVGPVCLPRGPHDGLLGEHVKVIGWGQTKHNGQPSPVLRKVNLRVIDLDICKTIYGAVNTKKRSQLCTWAPSRDTCQGDSGGPLIWRDPETNRFTQVGLISFTRECGYTEPGVNTDISRFMDWIQQTVAESGEAKICQ